MNSRQITLDGSTRLLGIVGHPIAQVRAPRVWSGLFAEAGINLVCVPFHIEPDDFERALPQLQSIRNLIGLTITVPYKFRAARLADSLMPRARQTGAVNLVRREPEGGWTGDMFDGVGFVKGLEGEGNPVAGRQALLVGAGGAGTAIAHALVEAGIGHLRIFDVDSGRAEALADMLRGGLPGIVSATTSNRPDDADLAINATPLGLTAADPLPIVLEGIRPAVTVADVIMEPARTRLLEEASARGCATHAGRHMMDYQIPMFAEFLRLPSGRWHIDAIAEE